MQRNYDYIFKIIIVGSSAVGKTSILLRFADDSFEQIYVSTLGVDFRFKSLYFGENFVKLQIWDTAGQQRFRGITNSYYKGSHAVIIVYDANDPKTFDQIKEYWVNEATKFCLPQNIYCVANKCDDPFKTYITLKQTQFCQKNKIKLFGISAKTGYNVKQSINLIVNDLIKKNPKIEQQKLKLELHQNHSTSNDKKCKC